MIIDDLNLNAMIESLARTRGPAGFTEAEAVLVLSWAFEPRLIEKVRETLIEGVRNGAFDVYLEPGEKEPSFGIRTSSYSSTEVEGKQEVAKEKPHAPPPRARREAVGRGGREPKNRPALPGVHDGKRQALPVRPPGSVGVQHDDPDPRPQEGPPPRPEKRSQPGLRGEVLIETELKADPVAEANGRPFDPAAPAVTPKHRKIAFRFLARSAAEQRAQAFKEAGREVCVFEDTGGWYVFYRAGNRSWEPAA